MIVSRRTILSTSLSVALTGGIWSRFARAELPKIRLGILRFGTAAWDLDVMRRNGFDTAQGIAIEPVEFASAPATQVALQAGRVDVILLDWLWVVAQRNDKADWTFAPFSSATGAVVAPPSSPVRSIADLPGNRLGIAGSPIDKSWLILQAYAKRKLGVDLDKAVKKSFGAPPLLAEELSAGQLDAVLTFWPFAARAEAAGMRRILGVEDMVHGLGITANVPMIGYVFSAGWAEKNRTAIDGFLAASRRSRALLDNSDDEWRRLKPLTGAADDAELEQLKNAYRRGIVHHWGDMERTAAAELYRIMEEIGGTALVGPSTAMPPGTFWPDTF